MIISSVTSMEIRKVKSRIVCAGLCISSSSCCSVSYDLQTSECQMDSNCFPDSATSQNGTFLRKSPYVTTSNQSLSYETTRTKTSFEPATRYKSSNETTYRVITTFDSTSFTKTSSTTASINLNNESGENSNNGTDQNTNNETGDNLNNGSDETIDVTRMPTTDNGTTAHPVDCSEVSRNDNLHQMLSSNNYKLRINLEDWNGETKFAEYDAFVVGSEETNYILTISGYSGDAGDSIINPPSGSLHELYGMAFSTFDRENDESPFYNAAEEKRSGWWFKWSTDANLNGLYYTGGQTANDGIYWNPWQNSEYSLKSVSMKIKPS
ncbi:Hypothetical predicted protein [Mytilus galloprovincialis]|uniref:Fibrinogen C-terminal domain-containing protein n=1 Tax=Mytilus galloprovincialis TaxID=29158 RepID=A0A8B6C6K1_MYTGA|nr:Hypothetical predicted protein [Mytilus galloprovincialis]